VTTTRLPGALVSAGWLAEHLAEVVVCDVRWYLDGRSGADAYDAGHIPRAVFVDLDLCLAGPPSPREGRHPLPEPEIFAGCMSDLGLGDDDAIVAYDDQSGSVAARLVWMLRATGHEAALLDGGLQAWRDPLVTGDEERPAAHFTPVPWPAARLALADEVERLAGRAGSVVVDARVAERYRGETEPIDPRAGHVPRAVNVPVAGTIDPESGRMRPARELRATFEAVGVRPGKDVIVYCGSGVNACHDLIALEVAGLGVGRLYAGSWSQWSSDPARPVATGDAP
jgi:thiosulfate/3-mercaptopyruvate sulfurtransferase